MAGDDRKLVGRCLAGDGDALRTLVETYQGSVFGLCYRMVRHREDAEDITQEVMLRAVRHLRHWDGERPLRPWILTIAANRCRTHLAKQVRQPVTTDHLAQVADERPPEHDPDLAAELHLAIATLRPEYRMVVTLFHDQELPYDEISEIIGRPVGTVKTWLHRARAELARHLAQRPGLRDMCRQLDELQKSD